MPADCIYLSHYSAAALIPAHNESEAHFVSQVFLRYKYVLLLLFCLFSAVVSLYNKMPTTEVTLVLSDWTKGNNGKKFELPHIQMTSPIIEVKKSVIQALDASDLKPESILLFIGSLVLRDDKLLKDYNKSGRSKLSVDVYERVDLNLKVKTLQSECFLLCVGFGPAPLPVGVGSQAYLYACLCSV